MQYFCDWNNFLVCYKLFITFIIFKWLVDTYWVWSYKCPQVNKNKNDLFWEKGRRYILKFKGSIHKLAVQYVFYTLDFRLNNRTNHDGTDYF